MSVLLVRQRRSKYSSIVRVPLQSFLSLSLNFKLLTNLVKYSRGSRHYPLFAMLSSISARIVRGLPRILIYPLLLMYNISIKHDQERRHGVSQYGGLRPNKLPRRRRALSVIPRVRSKEKSPFLVVLPAEIRQLILQYCLAGNQYHLWIKKSDCVASSVLRSPL